MDDPRLEIIKLFDPSHLHIKGFSPYIFFCGGLIEPDAQEPALSLRDSVLRHLYLAAPTLAARVTLAEDITDWFRDGIYADLISFETHIASLSALIVLFVESPGSLAELGAFCNIPAIANRLRVFIRDDYYENDSFIRLGPIQLLEKQYPGSVLVYPWKTRSDTCEVPDEESVKPILDDIVDDIKSAVHGVEIKEQLDRNDSGHIMLLMVDILDLMMALKQHELKRFLDHFSCNLNDSDFRRYIFLLRRLGLVAEASYGSDKYLVSLVGSFVSGHRFKESRFGRDRVAIKVNVVRQFYAEQDARRLKAIRRFEKSVAQGGQAS